MSDLNLEKMLKLPPPPPQTGGIPSNPPPKMRTLQESGRGMKPYESPATPVPVPPSALNIFMSGATVAIFN